MIEKALVALIQKILVQKFEKWRYNIAMTMIMAILCLHFSNFCTKIFWIKATKVFSIIGIFFQVSIKSLYLGLKMIALQSKYITDQ
jgi:hypothetical protein